VSDRTAIFVSADLRLKKSQKIELKGRTFLGRDRRRPTTCYILYVCDFQQKRRVEKKREMILVMMVASEGTCPEVEAGRFTFLLLLFVCTFMFVK
jgi:hypothetical protein